MVDIRGPQLQQIGFEQKAEPDLEAVENIHEAFFNEVDKYLDFQEFPSSSDFDEKRAINT